MSFKIRYGSTLILKIDVDFLKHSLLTLPSVFPQYCREICNIKCKKERKVFSSPPQSAVIHKHCPKV